MVRLAQRQINVNGYVISIGLSGNSAGYISIDDRNLYPDSDSRSERRNLNYHTLMVPCMTREQLEDLRISIDEVLKHSN